MAAPLKPSDIATPSPGRDPGVTAQPLYRDESQARALAQVGQAQQAFGRSIAALGAAAGAFAQRRQGAEDKTFIDQFDLEVAKRQTDLEIEALNNPPDDPDFVNQHDGRVAALHEEIKQNLRERGYSLSRDGETKWTERSLSYRTSSARNMVVGVNEARVLRLKETADATINEKAKNAATTGDIAGTLADVDATVESVLPAIPFNEREGFRKAARQRVYEMGLRGMAERAEQFAAQGKQEEAEAEIAKAKAVTDELTGFTPNEAPEAVPGMTAPGNIDLNDRPVVEVDGKPATVQSMSVNIDGKEYLIPTIADGRKLTDAEAVNRFRVTKEHLGMFETPEAATAYAKKLSGDMDALISGRVPRVISGPVVAAAKKYGVDPLLQLAIAKVESGLNPTAANKKSSARGLFQFIEETGKQYGLPADASRASVAAQADAGARFTADNMKALRNATGGEPSPGEVYLAHFLGLEGVANVLEADPDTPLSKLISAKAIAANGMEGWTAADLQGWAAEKMQGAMEYVTEAGFLEGRKVNPNEAGVPVDTAVQLHGLISQSEDRVRKLREEQEKAKLTMVNPAEPAEKRDPGGYVQKYDEEARKASLVAAEAISDPDTDPEVKADALRTAISVSLEAQEREGVPQRMRKPLPNDQAKAIVQSFVEAQGPAARDGFYSLKAQAGQHWESMFGQLVEQGLPPAYQMFDLLEPGRSAAQVNMLAAGLNQKEEDLKKDLPSSINQDILVPIEENLAPVMQAWETGMGPKARAQIGGIVQAVKNAALVHYRQHRDVGAAVDFASSIIEDNLQLVESGNISAVIPVTDAVNEADLEDAVMAAQTREAIEAFNPISFQALGRDPGFDMPRTLSAATNPGATTWVTSPEGDGVILLVQLGAGTALAPLVRQAPDGSREFYEVKFADIPTLAYKARVEHLTRHPDAKQHRIPKGF